MREAKITRNTKETQIDLTLNLDGSGTSQINTGCGFLDHMLELFTSHGKFDITLTCKGDTQVDFHHTAEDVAIVLGKAFDNALGDKAGITRYGSMILPMDEVLILAAVDISGRAALGYALEITTQKVGEFDTELVKEFMSAFSRSLGASVHFKQFAGENSHHIIEGAFKALARALSAAVAIDPRAGGKIPSTKGIIG
ncbi:MAG: imidazoleglycerol-phosphate dehydratase [Clostridiales bacterium GWF2_36_10]|nr:MAG: imidazoleglycerol-phosphate dehydratase [Clostridiales bacterium GWF2_36_10]HAN21615.1 imidazoleglycerol-phosphate dehydratase HisB [Clostridiales bacterium]